MQNEQFPSGHSFSSLHKGATLFGVQLVNTIIGVD